MLRSQVVEQMTSSHQHNAKTQSMQRHSGSNTHLKSCSFMPIVWILELINRTLVNWILLLRKEKRHRKNFEGKMEKDKGGEKTDSKSKKTDDEEEEEELKG